MKKNYQKRFQIFLLLLSCFFYANLNAKTLFEEKVQTTVKGTVTDNSGTPIPGVNVIIKGTSTGTTTDFDGKYEIKIKGENPILVFSFIGYTSKEVAVEGKSTIDVTLTDDVAQLEEVVVIGYGTQQKKDVTGATATVTGEKLVKAPTANLAANLSGKMTGVFVNTGTGIPGNEQVSFQIRGASTTGNNTPLIIVDGIVRPFTRINPKEIESMTVLKDAASTAVYGARAANGVLLITTKRGKAGIPYFSLETSLGFQSQTRKVELMNAGEYATYINEAKANYGLNPLYTEEEVSQYVSGERPSYNWLDAALSNSAPIKRYDFSASGGTDKSRYFVSYGLLDQNGFYEAASYKQHSLRSNLDANLKKNLILKVDLAAIIGDRNDTPSNYSTIYQGSLIAKPTLKPFLDEEVGPGALQHNGLGGNPIGYANRAGFFSNKTNTLQSNFSLEYKLPWIKGLKATGLYSYDLSFNKAKTLKKPFVQYEYNGATDSYDETRAGNNTVSLNENRYLYNQQTLQLSLNYKKEIGNHTIGGLALFEQTETFTNSLNAFRDNFISSQIPELFAGGTDLWSNTGSSSETARRGYVGRIEYNYAGKYLFQGNIRVDQSFNFPTSGRTGVFPAFSVGWRISDEAFMSKYEFINNLKLRASWGVIGNDRVPAFQYLSLFGFGGGYVENQNFQQGITSTGLSNPDITWETAKTWDIGLDASFLDGRLAFEIGYFNKRTEDILEANTGDVPDTFGASLPDSNFGIVDSWGFESALNFKQVIGEVKLIADANISWYKNKAIVISEAQGVLPSIARTGRRLGLRYGYLSYGLFQTQDEIDNAPTQFSTAIHNGLAPGDIRYKDINGRDANGNLTGQPDGKINSDDRAVIGSSGDPNLIYGINLSAVYKGFDLTANFQGASGFSRYLFSIPFERDGNSLKEYVDSWRPGNENAKYPRLSSGDASANNSQTSDYWVKEVSYLKLRNVELGYYFDETKPFIKQLGLETLRIYGSATNLLTFSNLGWRDPEGPSGGLPFYPQTKTLSLGMNIIF